MELLTISGTFFRMLRRNKLKIVNNIFANFSVKRLIL